jgi:hypothetical protein
MLTELEESYLKEIELPDGLTSFASDKRDDAQAYVESIWDKVLADRAAAEKAEEAKEAEKVVDDKEVAEAFEKSLKDSNIEL